MTRGDSPGGTAKPAVTPAEMTALDPDVTVEVRDPDTGAPVALTVREFLFREGLEATAAARPFIADLAETILEGDEAKVPDTLAVDAVIGKHADLWLDLTARACGREVAWLARLHDGDARAMRHAMWAANGDYFVRRIVAVIRGRGAIAASLLHSIESSIRSSAPDTGGATRH